VITAAVAELIPVIGARRACALTGRARASHYRDARGPVHGPPARRCSPPNKLTDAEVDALLALMNSPEFVDLAPAQIWAILLDSGTYLASISTMYRVLRAQDEVRERRRQATHPPRVRPELVARQPNQVWSWDITKLKGPAKGVYYDCYVIIDIFSRYVVGWMVAPTETAELAKAFIAATIKAHGIGTKVLTIHADRGTSMTSKPVAVLLAELGVTRTHSRPHVSNDNPFSEAAFKTLKYCPAFPERFGSIEDARIFCAAFFEYYNHHHRHSGIALHTPASMHFGTAADVQAARTQTLSAAYLANPRRFCNRRPAPPKMPTIAWINKPTITTDAQKKS
jgi:putative transposase